ncbi:MAG: hypothetical protein AB7K04_05670, partial [Pseudorhodoplanes sp.]
MTEPHLRAIKASRLSFMRTLIQRATKERWRITCTLCEVDKTGAGFLFYKIEAEDTLMYFGTISMPSLGADRSGRVGDSDFDGYGILGDGPIDESRLKDQLRAVAANIWSSRVDSTGLGLTLANRSTRVFEHVVERLSQEKQPDLSILLSGGGYIIRNIGWYGNGRHGSRSWRAMTHHPLGYPYHVDLFALYLWRTVSLDLAHATARARNVAAVELDQDLQKGIGLGNASGMGMVAALVRWPEWMGTYNIIREICLAHAVTQTRVDDRRIRYLVELLRRATEYYIDQSHAPAEEAAEFAVIADALAKVTDEAKRFAATGLIDGKTLSFPLRAIADFALHVGNRDAYEQTNSLLIEIFPEFADAVAALLPVGMDSDRKVRPAMTVGELQDLLRRRYAWALALDLTSEKSRHHFWYR